MWLLIGRRCPYDGADQLAPKRFSLSGYILDIQLERISKLRTPGADIPRLRLTQSRSAGEEGDLCKSTLQSFL